MVRATGKTGVAGVCEPSDEGAAFTKDTSISSGQCPVKRCNRQLRDLTINGQAAPSQIVSRELPLTEAPRAYDQFDKRVDGWTKVLLHPGKNG